MLTQAESQELELINIKARKGKATKADIIRKAELIQKDLGL